MYDKSGRLPPNAYHKNDFICINNTSTVQPQAYLIGHCYAKDSEIDTNVWRRSIYCLIGLD